MPGSGARTLAPTTRSPRETAACAVRRRGSLPASDLGVGQRALKLGVLVPRRTQHVPHADRFAGFGGQEGRVQRDIADTASWHVELGQFVHVKVLSRGLWR